MVRIKDLSVEEDRKLGDIFDLEPWAHYIHSREDLEVNLARVYGKPEAYFSGYYLGSYEAIKKEPRKAEILLDTLREKPFCSRVDLATISYEERGWLFPGGWGSEAVARHIRFCEKRLKLFGSVVSWPQSPSKVVSEYVLESVDGMRGDFFDTLKEDTFLGVMSEESSKLMEEFYRDIERFLNSPLKMDSRFDTRG